MTLRLITLDAFRKYVRLLESQADEAAWSPARNVVSAEMAARPRGRRRPCVGADAFSRAGRWRRGECFRPTGVPCGRRSDAARVAAIVPDSVIETLHATAVRSSQAGILLVR